MQLRTADRCTVTYFPVGHPFGASRAILVCPNLLPANLSTALPPLQEILSALRTLSMYRTEYGILSQPIYSGFILSLKFQISALVLGVEVTIY